MTVLVKDTFTGTNGTSIIGRTTEVGNKVWQRFSSSHNWQINNNMAAPVSTVWDSPVHIDAGVSDQVRYSIKIGVYNSSQQIHWRIVDNSNYYIWENNFVAVCVNGGWISKGNTGVTPKTGDILSIEVEGNVHKIFINTTLAMQFTDERHHTGTKFGFSTNSTAQRYDDFTIESLIETSTPPIPTILSINTPNGDGVISDEPNMDRATVTFTFDQDVTEWTVNVLGADYATGTVADSGGSVTANTEITAEIDWTELYSEGANQINIYGKNSNNQWTVLG